MPNSSPLVSVIMGVYDEPIDLIRRSITSIKDQTYKNIELLICLDNPNHRDAEDFLEHLSSTDKTIKLIKNKENIGLGFSLNKCIDSASGFYIARMDADDISHPQRIAKQVSELMLNDQQSLCFTEVKMVNLEGVEVPRKFPKNPTFKNNFFPDDAFVHATLLTSKELYQKYKYNISHSPEDYEMYFRMIAGKCKFFLINEPLYQYNFNSKQEWRSLAERCARTRKTALIMTGLLMRNYIALRECKGINKSFLKYIVMLTLSSSETLYKASSKLYSLFRKK